MSKGSSETVTTQQLADPYARQRGIQLDQQAQRLGAQPFQPYSGPRVAGFNNDWQAGATQMRQAGQMGMDNMAFASGAMRDAMGRPVGSFLTGDINAYMNPYQSGVIDAATGDMDRARQMQMQSDAANATHAGAFGGDRHGLVEAETNRGFADAASRMAANLRHQGFDTATGLMMSDFDRDMAGRGLTMQGAAMMPGLNAGMYDAAGQRLGLGREQMMNQQAQYDAQYEQYLRRLADPYQKLAAQQSILSSMPQNTTGVQTTETQGSFLGGLAGLAGIAGSFIPGVGSIAQGVSGLLGGGNFPSELPVESIPYRTTQQYAPYAGGLMRTPGYVS